MTSTKKQIQPTAAKLADETHSFISDHPNPMELNEIVTSGTFEPQLLPSLTPDGP